MPWEFDFQSSFAVTRVTVPSSSSPSTWNILRTRVSRWMEEGRGGDEGLVSQALGPTILWNVLHRGLLFYDRFDLTSRLEIGKQVPGIKNGFDCSSRFPVLVQGCMILCRNFRQWEIWCFVRPGWMYLRILSRLNSLSNFNSLAEEYSFHWRCHWDELHVFVRLTLICYFSRRTFLSCYFR